MIQNISTLQTKIQKKNSNQQALIQLNVEFLQLRAFPPMQQQKINHSIIFETLQNKQQETGIFHQNHTLEVVHNFREIMTEVKRIKTQTMVAARKYVAMVVVLTVMAHLVTLLRQLTLRFLTTKTVSRPHLVHQVIHRHLPRPHHRLFIPSKKI